MWPFQSLYLKVGILQLLISKKITTKVFLDIPDTDGFIWPICFRPDGMLNIQVHLFTSQKPVCSTASVTEAPLGCVNVCSEWWKLLTLKGFLLLCFYLLTYFLASLCLETGVQLQRDWLGDPAVQREHRLLLLPRLLQRREVWRMSDRIQRLSSGMMSRWQIPSYDRSQNLVEF